MNGEVADILKYALHFSLKETSLKSDCLAPMLLLNVHTEIGVIDPQVMPPTPAILSCAQGPYKIRIFIL